MAMNNLLSFPSPARTGLFLLALVVVLSVQGCGDDVDPASQGEESVEPSASGTLSGERTGPAGGGGGDVPPTASGVTGESPGETAGSPGGETGEGPSPTEVQPSIPSLSLPGEPSDERLDGAPCTEDAQCVGGTCLQEPAWPGGYCTTVGCETREDCINREDYGCLPGQGGRPSICVLLCEEPTDCRDAYICRPAGNASYCAPDPEGPPPSGPPSNGGGGDGPGQDGDTCATAAECLGDKCLTGAGWPGGYCSTSCSSEDDCNREGVGFGGFGLPGAICSAGQCYSACAAGFGCREGYSCDDTLSDTPSVGGCVGE